ncbi:MAG: LysR family transcriptional regulator, partial [Bdellovibrio sp.]|nr:LysR family transcriptional regulator [Bdellovibrio sp.]
MKIQNLEDLEAFLKVSEAGGFSPAAKLLNVPVSVVSKRVARLEETLAIRLFQRSTRAVNLTEEGKKLAPQIQRLFGDIREMEEQFSDHGELRGVIHLTMAWGLTQGPVAKILTEFRKKNPQVEVEVHFSDQFENLVERGYDLAIRFSSQEDSSMIARRLGPNYLKLIASPAYVKKNGAPTTVKELKEHPLLMIPSHRIRKFVKSGTALSELFTQSTIVSNNGLFITESAKA